MDQTPLSILTPATRKAVQALTVCPIMLLPSNKTQRDLVPVLGISIETVFPSLALLNKIIDNAVQHPYKQDSLY